MDKCDCWHKEERIVGWCGFSPLTKTVYECYGTKEREECQCMGDRGKCDFYPEVREKAKKDCGCEYCDFSSGEVGACINNSGDNFLLVRNYEGNIISVATDDVNFRMLKINFCPMCGRDLRKG